MSHDLEPAVKALLEDIKRHGQLPALDRNIVDLCRIAADMQTMSENQIEARIYGKHVADNKMAVFDLAVLHEMRKELKEPQQVTLTTSRKLAEAIAIEGPRPDRRLSMQCKPLVKFPSTSKAAPLIY